MNILHTEIDGLYVAETAPFQDERGCFARFFCDKELQKALGDRHIVQINHSLSRDKATVRGLHYQKPPFAEMKLIRCLKGRAWDVAVDLRKDSPTFLQWHAEELSEENRKMFIIPEGFAHGFQVLEDNTELLYLHTAHYDKASEEGVNIKEPMISIAWPLPAINLSERDSSFPYLANDFDGVSV